MLDSLMMGPIAAFNVGPWEVIVIAIVALLLFGHRLPDVARSAGRAVVEFKKGLRDVGDDVDKAAKDKPAETKDAAKNDDKKA